VKALPLALPALGIGAATVLTGGAFWPFALAWIAAAGVVALLLRVVRRPIAIAVPAAAACVLFTFEGGLFLLPAAISLALVDASPEARSDRSALPGS
jgi:hypothetical protein